jgi:hypothetical protein
VLLASIIKTVSYCLVTDRRLVLSYNSGCPPVLLSSQDRGHFTAPSYFSNCRLKILYFFTTEAEVKLAATASRPVYLDFGYPYGDYYQICLSVQRLRVSCYGSPSSTRDWVRNLLIQFFLYVDSTVVLGLKSAELVTIFYCLITDSPDFQGLRICIPEEQSGPLIPQGTGSLFRNEVEVEFTLRLTVSHSVWLGIEHPCGPVIPPGTGFF